MDTAMLRSLKIFNGMDKKSASAAFATFFASPAVVPAAEKCATRNFFFIFIAESPPKVITIPPRLSSAAPIFLY